MPKQIWHERMGYIGESALQQLPKRVSGVEFSTDRNKQSAQPCEICIQSKSTKHVSREPPSMPAQAYLDLVHPDLQNIRTFGSLVYRLRPIRKKLDPKADPWTLIGYGSNQWKILNEATGITTWARDVTILEGKLPKRDNHIGDQPIIHEEEELTHDYKPLYPINPVVQTPKPMEKEMTDFPSLSEPMSDEEDAEDVPPHTNLIDQLAAGDDVEMAYSAMALGAMPVDPITFKEATSGRNSSDWLAAMELEISTLREQRVWSLVKPPANRKIVRGRWVFKTKLDQNGHIDKRKAR